MFTNVNDRYANYHHRSTQYGKWPSEDPKFYSRHRDKRDLPPRVIPINRYCGERRYDRYSDEASVVSSDSGSSSCTCVRRNSGNFRDYGEYSQPRPYNRNWQESYNGYVDRRPDVPNRLGRKVYVRDAACQTSDEYSGNCDDFGSTYGSNALVRTNNSSNLSEMLNDAFGRAHDRQESPYGVEWISRNDNDFDADENFRPNKNVRFPSIQNLDLHSNVAMDGGKGEPKLHEDNYKATEYRSRSRSTRKKFTKFDLKKCRYCMTAGLPSNHGLYNEEGEVICPLLSKYQCPFCSATGTKAHTLKYCPKNPILRGDINNIKRLPKGVAPEGHRIEAFRMKYPKTSCNFCAEKGFQNDHPFRDRDGGIACPVLFNQTCPLCGATGKLAHTYTYCPIYKESVKGTLLPQLKEIFKEKLEYVSSLHHSNSEEENSGQASEGKAEEKSEDSESNSEHSSDSGIVMHEKPLSDVELGSSDEAEENVEAVESEAANVPATEVLQTKTEVALEPEMVPTRASQGAVTEIFKEPLGEKTEPEIASDVALGESALTGSPGSALGATTKISEEPLLSLREES
uniref:Nanos n=1 Tax=Parhyale hawaiensis TaxID=317513 RepID=B7SFX9_9CRUS|nr:nanos [Parhyale hawaiensis]